MEKPIALKLRTATAAEGYQVSIDLALADQLRKTPKKPVPAIVVTQKAAIFAPMSAGMIDAADVVAVSEGDWNKAILVVLPETSAPVAKRSGQLAGDAKFLEHLQRDAPSLAELAEQTVAAIRAAGVDGELMEAGGGRWVNRPLNTFTLKAQPRAANLHFTLYGNPESYNHDEFLRRDQNSYSRGWVRGTDDIGRLVELLRQSHARRKR